MKMFDDVSTNITDADVAAMDAMSEAHDNDKNRRKARWESNQEAHHNGGRKSKKKGGKKGRYDDDWDGWN
jgi:hypothetical protein